VVRLNCLQNYHCTVALLWVVLGTTIGALDINIRTILLNDGKVT